MIHGQLHLKKDLGIISVMSDVSQTPKDTPLSYMAVQFHQNLTWLSK